MDLIKRLDALGYIGATPEGITRVAGSAATNKPNSKYPSGCRTTVWKCDMTNTITLSAGFLV